MLCNDVCAIVISEARKKVVGSRPNDVMTNSCPDKIRSRALQTEAQQAPSKVKGNHSEALHQKYSPHSVFSQSVAVSGTLSVSGTSPHGHCTDNQEEYPRMIFLFPIIYVFQTIRLLCFVKAYPSLKFIVSKKDRVSLFSLDGPGTHCVWTRLAFTYRKPLASASQVLVTTMSSIGFCCLIFF